VLKNTPAASKYHAAAGVGPAAAYRHHNGRGCRPAEHDLPQIVSPGIYRREIEGADRCSHEPREPPEPAVRGDSLRRGRGQARRERPQSIDT
jgi:hypothetical protein